MSIDNKPAPRQSFFRNALLMLFMCMLFFAPLNLMALYNSPVPIDQGWQYRFGDAPLNADGAPLWVYDSPSDSAWRDFQYPGQPPNNLGMQNVWLRTQLPMSAYRDPALFFITNDQAFEVFLGDRLIYRHLDIAHFNDNQAPGSPWHLIPLPEDYPGQMLHIRMHTMFSRNVGLVRRFEIGSRSDHITGIIAEDADSAILSSLFVFLGLILFFIFLIRRSVRTAFPSLGFFSVCIGIWLISESNIKQLFLDWPRAWLYIAFSAFYLMPIGFCSFVEQIFKENCNIYVRWMRRLHTVFAVVALTLDITGLFPVIFTLQPFYVLLFLSILTIFATIVRAARQGSIEIKVFIWGFSIFSLFGIYDILGYFFRIVPWTQFIIPYGMFVFLLAMIYILGRRFADVYDKMKVYSEEIAGKNEALAAMYQEVTNSKERLSEWNRSLEQTVERRTASVRNLLNNAGQGFLTFGRDLVVHGEYSAECRNLLAGSIEGTTFPQLIYPEAPDQQVFLEALLLRIIHEPKEARRHLYLPLLPEEIQVGGKHVHIGYKLIKGHEAADAEVFMAILTDITDKRLLESKVEQERNILKMVVKVITCSDDFNEIVRDYEAFCRDKLEGLFKARSLSPEEVLYEVYRSIHTYKGAFLQFETVYIVHRLHQFETALTDFKDKNPSFTLQELRRFIEAQSLGSWLEEDIQTLRNILGDHFLQREGNFVINKSRLLAIEEKMLAILSPNECGLLLPDIRRLRYKPFHQLLKWLPEYAERLAARLEKPLSPVVIEGGGMLVDTDLYHSFSKALTHVIRNMVDHGLEAAEERLSAGKPEYAAISCSISMAEGHLCLTLSDNGRGFELEKIKDRLTAAGILSAAHADSIRTEELIDMLIDNHLSTKDSVSSLSGRGIGLSAVKCETEKLNGRFRITTVPGEGTVFQFIFPYGEVPAATDIDSAAVMRPVIENAIAFLGGETGSTVVSHDIQGVHQNEHIFLKDFTAFVAIRGIVTGRFVLTACEGLAGRLLDAILLDDLSEAERDYYIEDALAESANVIVGNAIKAFPGLENLVVMEPPVAVRIKGAAIRFLECVSWTCSLDTEYGSLSISFVTPSGSNISIQ